MEAGQTRCKGERDKGHHPLEAIPGPWYFSVSPRWACAELVLASSVLVVSLPPRLTPGREGSERAGFLHTFQLPTICYFTWHLCVWL